MEDSDLLGCDYSLSTWFPTFRSTVSLWSSRVDCASNAGSRLLKGVELSPRLHHYEKLKTRNMLRYIAFVWCISRFCRISVTPATLVSHYSCWPSANVGLQILEVWTALAGHTNSSAAHFLKIRLNIILPSKPGSSEWSLSPIYRSHLCLIRATCLARLIILDYITRTKVGEENRSLSSSLCSFLHSPFTSPVLSPNFLNTLFSNTLLTTSVFQNLDGNGCALKSSIESREEEMLRTSRVVLRVLNADIYEHFFHEFGRHELYFQMREWVAYWLVNAKGFCM